MSVTAVGFVPAAPLLVPAVAGGSAGLDAALRAASMTVVARLIATHPEEVVVAAPVPATGTWPSDATWDFAGFGVPRQDAVAAARLPWSIGLGAWLLDESGWTGARRYVGVDPAGVGESLTTANSLILVVGDGSGCRTEKAPGHLDPRAEAYDADVTAALSSGDVDQLGALDPDLSRELLCAGAPVWRWLGATLAGQAVTKASVDVAEAPYGVGYFVASWLMT